MAENIMGALKHEWCSEDLKALADQVKKDESTLRLKRRWLMDLPLSEKEQKKIDKLLPPNDKIMPESFLREDDVGYDEIKTCIEMAFGARKSLEEPICVQDDVTILNLFDDLRETSFVLDAMNNKGLYSFAKILTGGLITFDKTNLSMKRAIRELLPKVIAEKNDISKTKLKRCSLLLKDPTNFLGNPTVQCTVSESYRANALKVLDGLEDFPRRTLHAMNRKLKGDKGYIPRLQPQKSGRSHENLVNTVRKRCTEMLSDIGTGDEPSEPLAGALGVAGLTLKLIMNCPDVTDFRKFSPEIEALHNDIAKAIHLLNEPNAVSLIELKRVQLLLDPNFELSVRSLRMAVRNFLIEYLYECSDMSDLPDFLIETINIINRRAQPQSRRKNSSSRGFSSHKEEIEKEIQQVLNISALAKEVVANLLPGHGFDEEFADAYIENYDGSDTMGVFLNDQRMEDGYHGLEFRSCSSCGQTESIGEINPAEFNSPVSRSTRGSCLPLSPMGRSDSQTSMDSKALDPAKVTTQPRTPLFHSPDRQSSPNELKTKETTSCSPATTRSGFSAFKVEETDSINQQSRSINKYLELQEACDATSMTAYRFVGSILNTLARTEGLELYRGDRLYLNHQTSDSNDTEEFSEASTSNLSEMWKKVLEQSND